MIFDLIVRTILTLAIYFLANLHTYRIGIHQNSPPLHDCFHDILPDWSLYPFIRDLVLPLYLIPIFCIKEKAFRRQFIFELWEIFILIVTFKAIAIFFTFLPPSNTYCHETRQLNHTYHQLFSGHNAFVFLLFMLYIKYGVMEYNLMNILPFISYSILILMTRCHYSIDIIISFAVVLFLTKG